MIRLMQGDCLELMKQIPDKSVDLVLCDPPYGINYQSARRPKEQRFSKIVNDKQPFSEFIKPAIRILKDTGCMLIFTRWDVQSYFIDEINAGGVWRSKMSLSGTSNSMVWET